MNDKHISLNLDRKLLTSHIETSGSTLINLGSCHIHDLLSNILIHLLVQINVDKYIDAVCYSGGDLLSRVWFQTISKKIFIKFQVSIKKIKDKLF